MGEAASITLVTFPLLAGLSEAPPIFNVVFFVVLTSVLLQGTRIPLVARWLSTSTKRGLSAINGGAGPATKITPLRGGPPHDPGSSSYFRLTSAASSAASLWRSLSA